MKTFNKKMLKGVGADIVSVPYLNEGVVDFKLNPRKMATIIGLRREVTKQAQSLGENPDSAEANVMLYTLSVKLVQTALAEKLTDDEAMLLITNCGGLRGRLVTDLAIRFGVSDLLAPASTEGDDQEEIPI